MKNQIRNCLGYLVIAPLILWSCEEKEEAPKPVAGFDSEISTSEKGKVSFTNTSTNANSYTWDFGDGSATSTEENPTHTYTLSGSYTVTLTATGVGGTDMAQENVTVAVEMQLGNNIIANGDMENADGWIVYGLGAPNQTVHEFADGKLIFTNGENQSQVNTLLWQEIHVDAGSYLFAADVKSDGNSTKTWIEFYFQTAAPVDGVDISGFYIAMKNFDACLNNSYDGNIVTLDSPCKEGSGKDADGIVTFQQSGTIYFAIKCGTWDGDFSESGIIVDNVSLRKIQ